MGAPLPIGCFVHLEKPNLQSLLDQLRQLGYRVIGPTLAQSAVVYGEISSLAELPVGWSDEQEGGRYRLHKTDSNNYFDYVVGPHSLKNFLFPPHTTVLETIRVNGSWQMQVPETPGDKLAFLGARSCDLHALLVQDLVFLSGHYVDPAYQARRQGIFVAAVNCSRSASTCFCASMDTGPAVTLGHDLVLTELPGHFVVEVGSEAGGTVLAEIPWRPCTTAEVAEARQVPRRAAQQQQRQLNTRNIRDLLLGNLEHPRWDEVAGRCLACTNCTMVCPTCFCSSVQEVAALDGERVQRQRSWDSCFNDQHSFMTSGAVRQSTRARYRQWLTHKLASWLDQYGTSGCVGCGRCITWCPVGIDLTAEVEAIRRDQL